MVRFEVSYRTPVNVSFCCLILKHGINPLVPETPLLIRMMSIINLAGAGEVAGEVADV